MSGYDFGTWLSFDFGEKTFVRMDFKNKKSNGTRHRSNEVESSSSNMADIELNKTC